jgi:Iap family predicted aminopeptidase
MKNGKRLLVIGFAFVLLVAALGACRVKGDAVKVDDVTVDGGAGAAVSEEEAYAAFEQAVDAGWAYDLAVEVIESGEYADNRLGDRQSGSDAEHRTAEKIESVMNDIGLTDVTKDAVKVDRIQAGDSGVTLDGDEREIILHAYQTVGTPEGGLAADIVDVGRGTATEYEDKDVEGQIVLLDVDQRADWWIGSPVTQAIEKGAAAVLANNVSGFSEIATDAYNANDFCGPATIPTASITQDDAGYVREKMQDGRVKAKLVIDNEYSEDGESYNVYGTIKGRDSSEAVLFGAHYDAYYESFQDDTIAWTGALAIAKGMIDSGYEPERDIVFCCHGAEEWGEADTSYDWALGSYRQITEAKEDWQGRVISFINFELPAYEFADYTYTHSAPESYNMIRAYTEAGGTAQPDGVYSDGILTEGYQTYTYSDDFAYYVAGVPSFINGFLVDVKSEDGDVFDFYKKYYHTNYDTKETYNEGVFDWQLKFYGGLGIHIDKTPALELDFTSQTQRLTDALDEEIAQAAGADTGAYVAAVSDYNDAAEALASKVEVANASFAEAGTDEDRASALEEARALNQLNLAIFKKTQEYLLGLQAEDPIVPHEWYQANVALIDETLGYLEEGDGATALDETAWQINGACEWYSMHFDEATVEHINGTYQGRYASQNWATDRVYEFADVGQATRSLMTRAHYGEENAGFDDEMKIYSEAKAAQQALLKQMIEDETSRIAELTAMMAAV